MSLAAPLGTAKDMQEMKHNLNASSGELLLAHGLRYPLSAMDWCHRGEGKA